MENKTAGIWQERFGLTMCKAEAIEQMIPASALGVAVVYGIFPAGEKIYLVIESRAGSLRGQCLKRLQSGKLPAVAELSVAFQAETLVDTAPETVQTACRQQVILAGELRRELRPAMR